MKKITVLLFFIMIAISVFAQSISFVKKITNNDMENWATGIVQGQNGHYYMTYRSQNYSLHNHRNLLMHYNEWGNKIDSIKLDTLLSIDNLTITKIDKLKNNFLYFSTLADNVHHYFYIRIFDQNLQTITEKVIDTLEIKEYVIQHIENKLGHHIFLAQKNDSGSIWKNIFYVTDSNFNVINKANTNYSDGYIISMVEIPVDSSYLITTRHWIIKTNYDFSFFDTVYVRPLTINWCQAKRYNDSLYFENAGTAIEYVGGQYFTYPGFYVKTKNATPVDTISFPINAVDNDITQMFDFFDFITPDTIFYTSEAYSVELDLPNNDGFMLAKMGFDKTIYWQKYFGFNGNYEVGTVTATADGGCIAQWGFWDWVKFPDNKLTETIIMVKTDKYGNAPTGIDENLTVSDKQVLVYPNPTTANIQFEAGFYDKLQLQVFNSLGCLQTEKVLTQGNNCIDVSNYASGLYFYRILYKGKFLENGKFIKE